MAATYLLCISLSPCLALAISPTNTRMTQVPGLGQAASNQTSLQQQQQLMLQRQQQAAAANAAASGGLQHRPPAKQNVAMARPAAGFSSAAVRPPLLAPGAAQPAAKPPVSAADMIPAAKRKKRKLMDNRLPEKVKPNCNLHTNTRHAFAQYRVTFTPPQNSSTTKLLHTVFNVALYGVRLAGIVSEHAVLKTA